MTETTFVIFKADALRRGICGPILQRFEQAGLALQGLKLIQAGKAKAAEHYKEHEGQYFYQPLVDLLCSGPIIVAALHGAHAVELVRKLVGSTEPLKAAPGTIRGDFSLMSYPRAAERMGVISNLIHASDSLESAKRELAIWFEEDELNNPVDRCDQMYF